MGALNNLLLLQYNNYFNRIIKREETFEAYIEASDNNKVIEQVNFNPNDDIETEHVIVWYENWMPDYLVLFNDENNIVSRWYIMESVRLRGKQYKLTLRRDVIADYRQQVINSPCYVEKGFVPKTNPLIYNQENITTNQIKQREWLLHDYTKTSWLVLYYNLSKKSDLHGTIALTSEPYDEISTPIAEYYADIQANGFGKVLTREFKILASYGLLGQSFVYDQNSNFLWMGDTQYYTERHLKYVDMNPSEAANYIQSCLKVKEEGIRAALENDYKGDAEETFRALVFSNGKIIKDSLGKFYRVTFRPTGEERVNINSLSSGDTYNQIRSAFYDSLGNLLPRFTGRVEPGETIESRITSTVYELKIEELPSNEIQAVSYDFTSIKNINDQPYGIIALPYLTTEGEDSSFYEAFTPYTKIKADSRLSLLIARDLAKAGTGGDKMIYDIQLLPFSPVPYLPINIYGNIELWRLNSDNYVKILDSDSNTVSYALCPTKSKMTFNIDVDVLEDYHELTDVEELSDEEYKMNAQTEFLRLCSPNFNGMFEFSAYKNNGVSYFNVDCTFKPYQPYIHINPDFKNLYGADYNDPRGLICGGDFSITVVSDAWESYKLQNKNYQAIFDRQIENMEVNNKIANERAALNTALGIVGGGIAGAKKGGAAGAVAGVAGAAVGGVANIAFNIQKQAENKDYAKDMHEFSMQNIQALPNAMSKVDAYNNNNKIFPVLEKYGCTEVEKNIYLNKLQYEGMTINALGTIAQYKGEERTFCKGQMIRIEDVYEDTHLLNAIYEEIAKGVYL